MEIDLQKLTPRDLAAVGRNIHEIGGSYIVYSGNLARYQSNNRGLNIEFNINSLVEYKNFACSLPVDMNINKQIGELSKGKGQVTFVHENGKYRFTNQSRTVTLRCANPNLQIPAIDDQIYGFNKIEGPNAISTKGELSLTGREISVCLLFVMKPSPESLLTAVENIISIQTPGKILKTTNR